MQGWGTPEWVGGEPGDERCPKTFGRLGLAADDLERHIVLTIPGIPPAANH